MNVVFDKPVDSKEAVLMRLYSLNSVGAVKQWQLQGGQKQYSLNRADLKRGQYVLEVTIGKVKLSKQVIVE